MKGFYRETTTSDFSDHPTLNLLLHCVAPATDERTVHHIQSLAQGEIDWQTLVKVAKDHRVVPLLHQRLSTACSDAVPASILKDLRTYCQVIALRNLYTTAELRRLLLLMKSEGIDTLPYKGPVLTQMLYKDLKLRQFGDLDIVVQPKDVTVVEKLLAAEGYHPYFGQKSAAELDAYMNSKNEHTYDFYHTQKKIFIEIHWRFWPLFFSTVNPKDIWHQRETFDLAGATVTNFQIEDYLIILCMHGSRHQWDRLSWICDIALLLKNYPELDWQKTFEAAEQWGAKRMLALGLYLAHVWLNVPLPKEITERILGDSTIATLANEIRNQTFKTDKTPKRFMRITRYHIRARERWQDKFLYAQSFIYWASRGFPSEHHTS